MFTLEQISALKAECVNRSLTNLVFLLQVFIKSELKVGVIYVREGQYSEEDILSNNRESEHFTQFLSILGEKVRLKGKLHKTK
jgi:hypothetical protein